MDVSLQREYVISKGAAVLPPAPWVKFITLCGFAAANHKRVYYDNSPEAWMKKSQVLRARVHKKPIHAIIYSFWSSVANSFLGKPFHVIKPAIRETGFVVHMMILTTVHVMI